MCVVESVCLLEEEEEEEEEEEGASAGSLTMMTSQLFFFCLAPSKWAVRTRRSRRSSKSSRSSRSRSRSAQFPERTTCHSVCVCGMCVESVCLRAHHLVCDLGVFGRVLVYDPLYIPLGEVAVVVFVQRCVSFILSRRRCFVLLCCVPAANDDAARRTHESTLG